MKGRKVVTLMRGTRLERRSMVLVGTALVPSESSICTLQYPVTIPCPDSSAQPQPAHTQVADAAVQTFGNIPFLPSTTPFREPENMASTLEHRHTPTTTSSSSGSDTDEPITYKTTSSSFGDGPSVPRATLQKKDWRPKATIHLRTMAERTFAEKICSLAFPPESLHGQLPFPLPTSGLFSLGSLLM